MDRVLESLLKRTGRIFIAGSLVFSLNASYADKVYVEHKAPITTTDINNDGNDDEVYFVNIEETLFKETKGKSNSKSLRFVEKYNLVAEIYVDFGKRNKKILKQLPKRAVELNVDDVNKDGKNDLSYIVESDNKEHKQEKYAMYGDGKGNFSSPEFRGYVD